MAAINSRKMKYALLRGSFGESGIKDFLRDLSYGRGSTAPVAGDKLPQIDNREPWDGKDGEVCIFGPLLCHPAACYLKKWMHILSKYKIGISFVCAIWICSVCIWTIFLFLVKYWRLKFMLSVFVASNEMAYNLKMSASNFSNYLNVSDAVISINLSFNDELFVYPSLME